MTRTEFAAGIAYLEAATGQPVPKERAQAWFDLAGDLDGNQFLHAIKHVLRTRDARKDGHFVQISEIMRAADATGNVIDGNNRPQLAWSACIEAVRRQGRYRSVDFSDPLINATVRTLGGWAWLCDTETAELQWVERRFQQQYRAFLAGGASAEMCAHLPGEIETGNRTTGHVAHIPEPETVDCGLPALPPGKVFGEHRRIDEPAKPNPAIARVAGRLGIGRE